MIPSYLVLPTGLCATLQPNWLFCYFCLPLSLSVPRWRLPLPLLPLIFEPNRRQAPTQVRYLLRGGALEGEFQTDGVRLKLFGNKQVASQVRMRLVGARADAALVGGGELQGHTNYLGGNDPTHWLRGLPNYTKVLYSQIYSGTGSCVYGNGGSLEHDLELQPGAGADSKVL
jgi:hypothetical protein